jgi:hypothetical protein
MKTAVVVLANPGSDESLGRVYNALESVREFKTAGDDVKLYFDGAGTRWLSELAKPDHIAHSLYLETKDRIAASCSACANVFGASQDAQTDALVPISSAVSYRDMLQQGYQVLTF